MIPYAPEQRVRHPALRAEWLCQAFVHWPFQLEEVQALLPDGLVADEYDGAAWVGFTPFLMAGVRPLGLPADLPGLRPFPEMNLRTFVRRPDGREGLWFLSIRVGRAVMLAARAIGAPYHLSELSICEHGDAVAYAGSRRRSGGPPSYFLTLRVGEPMEPSYRDVWLTSRWRAYTRRAGLLWETPVEHEPWPLSEATIEDLHQSLTAEAGLPAPSGQPLAHFSEGVRHVRLGTARPLRPAVSGSR